MKLSGCLRYDFGTVRRVKHEQGRQIVEIALFWSVTSSSLAEVYRLKRGLFCQPPCLWKQEVLLKRWNTCTRLHGLAFNKAAICT